MNRKVFKISFILLIILLLPLISLSTSAIENENFAEWIEINGEPYAKYSNGQWCNKGAVKFKNGLKGYCVGNGKLLKSEERISGRYKYSYDIEGHYMPSERKEIISYGTFPAPVTGKEIYVRWSGLAYSFYQSGGLPANNKHAVFVTSDPLFSNSPVICGEHALWPPMTEGNEIKLTLKLFNDNTNIRKILYYGWKGPKEWEGFQKYASCYNNRKDWAGLGITANLLTYAYRQTGQGSGTWYNVAGYNEFQDFISKAPAPPSGFQVYRMNTGNNEQDLFTWLNTVKGPDKWGKSTSDGTLKLIKRSGSLQTDHLKSLKGAQYSVYTDQFCLNKAGTLITGENGESNILTLPGSIYYLKEEKAPEGYRINPDLIKCAVDNGGNTVVETEDYLQSGKIRVKKSCNEEYEILPSFEKAEYSIYASMKDAEDKINSLKVLTTSADGYSPYEELSAGTAYYIRETKAPEGFYIDNKIYKVTLADGMEKTLHVKDKPLPAGSITLFKKFNIETGENTSDDINKSAEFVVYRDWQCNLPVKEFKTSASTGMAELKNIVPGTYYVKEKTAPKHCTIDNNVHKINVEPGKTTTINIVNEIKASNVKLKKHNSDTTGKTSSFSLANAVYEISDQNGNYHGMLVTDNMGNTDSICLPLGRYTAHEIQAPLNFNLGPDIQFNLEEKDKGKTVTFDVYDSPKEYKESLQSITLLKKNGNPEYRQTMNGQVYGIFYDKETKNMYTEITFLPHRFYKQPCTSKEIFIQSPGTYYIKELVPPEGFALNPEVYEIQINEGEHKDLEVWDYPVSDTGTFMIRKTPERDNNLLSMCPENYNLEDAEYVLYEDKNCINKICKLVTGQQQKDSQGKLFAITDSITLEGNKTYYIKESKSPKGYIKDHKIYESYIDKGKNITLVIEEKPDFSPITLMLRKHIENGSKWSPEYLKDAEYKVSYYKNYYYSEEELKGKKPDKIWLFKTDNKGEFRFEDKWKTAGDSLFKDEEGKTVNMRGTYCFEEIKAPEGFIKNEGVTIRQIKENRIPFNVDENILPGDINVASEKPDKSLNRQITVTKRISEDNVYKDFGVPVTIFKCEGEDVFGNVHTYYKSITLDENNLNGKFYEETVSFNNLPAGKYVVSELKNFRYKIKSIYDISLNGYIENNMAYFEMVNSRNGNVTFENHVSSWEGFSDSQCVINSF